MLHIKAGTFLKPPLAIARVA